MPLLWRIDTKQLPDSQEIALKRLEGLKQGTTTVISNLFMYTETEHMNTVINSGGAEIVPDEQACEKNKIW